MHFTNVIGTSYRNVIKKIMVSRLLPQTPYIFTGNSLMLWQSCTALILCPYEELHDAACQQRHKDLISAATGFSAKITRSTKKIH